MDGELRVLEPVAFDPARLRSSGLRPRLQNWLLDRLSLLYPVLRAFPILRVGGLVIAARRDDVEEILANTSAFKVRSAFRIVELQQGAGIPNPPPLFVLGTDDPAAYGSAMQELSKAVLLDDVSRLADGIGRFVAAEIGPSSVVDIGRLSLLAPAELVRTYFGLDVAAGDLKELSLCCLALIFYGFESSSIESPTGQVALGAVARISYIVRRSIEKCAASPDPDTVITKLIRGGMARPDVEATVTGLTMALVGATAVATVNVTQVLLRRAEAMTAARKAALAGDDVTLGRCLLEALRFKPLSPGPFRICAEKFVIAEGTWRARCARPGDLVLPVTHSAMFDPRRVDAPKTFNPDRMVTTGTMVFSYGLHLCVGFAIGRMQLIEMLKPLLRRGLSQTSADRSSVNYFGPFPEHFPVRLG